MYVCSCIHAYTHIIYAYIYMHIDIYTYIYTSYHFKVIITIWSLYCFSSFLKRNIIACISGIQNNVMRYMYGKLITIMVQIHINHHLIWLLILYPMLYSKSGFKSTYLTKMLNEIQCY
jgi:hypothetical protein